MEHSICVVCIKETLGHDVRYPDWKYLDTLDQQVKDIKTLDQLMDAAANYEPITDPVGRLITGTVFAITIMNGNMVCRYHAINSYWNNGTAIG